MAWFQRFGWRSRAALACLAMVGVALYWNIPRRADLRTFHAAKMAVREDVPAETYGRTIAATSALLYGRSDELMLQSGVERAQAMAFRDQHRNTMADANWSAIELRLFKAYSKLRRSINPVL